MPLFDFRCRQKDLTLPLLQDTPLLSLKIEIRKIEFRLYALILQQLVSRVNQDCDRWI